MPTATLNPAPPTKLSPPWVEYAEKLHILFASDPDVGVECKDDAKIVTIRVNGTRKADALSRLIPQTVAFGNVTLNVKVVPANEKESPADLLRTAFAGNPAVEGVETYDGPLGNPLVFCVCARDPVDVPCDNMADPNGNRTMLVETLAREVVGDRASAFFCTAPKR